MRASGIEGGDTAEFVIRFARSGAIRRIARVVRHSETQVGVRLLDRPADEPAAGSAAKDGPVWIGD